MAMLSFTIGFNGDPSTATIRDGVRRIDFTKHNGEAPENEHHNDPKLRDGVLQKCLAIS